MSKSVKIGFISFAMALCATSTYAQTPSADIDTTLSLQQGSTQTEATKITENIYMAEGFGNTFLITTAAGNVIIDTSMERNAKNHKALLNAVDNRDPEYIIITHAHGDHIGGVETWKADTTKVIQQLHAEEFLHYQERLKGFFQRRNAAQFGFDLAEFNHLEAKTENYGASIPADIFFNQSHSFELGGLTFEIISTPSETYDALSVYIPEQKTVFTGDLYYESFPNIYTLRGTKPRWALDYVEALNTVLALEAEILIPSHGDPIYGKAEIETALTIYRDAILYVHDAVVLGMNQGKSVGVLAREIELPEALKIREIYGRVDWSVRGIYEGYAGWFDGNPSTMLGVDKAPAHASIIKLAGGNDNVVALAKQKLANEYVDEALTLAEMVLESDPAHKGALEIKRLVFMDYLQKSQNFNESGWLKAGIRAAENTIEKD